MATTAILGPQEVKMYYPYPVFVYPGQPFPSLPEPSVVPPKLPITPLEDVHKKSKENGENINTTVRNLWFPPKSAPSATAKGAAKTSANGNENRNTKQPPKNVKRKAPPPAAASASKAPVAPASTKGNENGNTKQPPKSLKRKAPPATTLASNKAPVAPAQKRQATEKSTPRVSSRATSRAAYATKTAPGRPFVPPTVNPPPQLSWDEMYKQLEHYQKGYGHCRVAKGYTDVPGLAAWVTKLRRQRREFCGQLTLEQEKRLDTLAFDWTLKDASAVISWDERFGQLKAYKEEHGHYNVPRTYKDVKGLGEWVHTQRRNYRAKQPLMMKEYAHRLIEINFPFVSSRANARPTWDQRFSQLIEFRRQNGNFNIPKLIQKNRKFYVDLASCSNVEGEVSADGTASGTTGLPSGPGEALTFCRWVNSIRRCYWLEWKQQKFGTLDKKRVKQLDEMGFDWGAVRTQGPGGRPKKQDKGEDGDEEESSQYESANEEGEEDRYQGAPAVGRYGHGVAYGHDASRGMI